ncbi:substrate-binding domain-containing protein [Deinococcus cellulosilyticus]|uniref:HTH cro/C1-type domain-containing protein n=1 Tax=Deinococcus cellulosilyticus (strain DSM 18568 / NBRC 106333 / KACC 11606 / 5516J-15) TaxID=1223518 RepID=A0A511N322_DEIC1|nr:substrate-binding domain-containing protein [Deinococcus cellulosilyticus]GEM47255.1 hypothetical protein DC3_28900 [Deinococcus cellulosilyticus NBRC 106333 = KACC 11606]
MADLINHLQQKREALGISRSALAERTGLSRQAIHSIEQGKYIPNTLVALQLAKVLKCQVEDLFQIPAPEAPVARWLGNEAQEGDRVLLARVGSLLCAVPIADPDRFSVAADAVITRVEGTNLSLEPLTEPELWDSTLLISGCDPALKMVARQVKDHRVLVVHQTSLDSLALLAEGQVHAAGIHLYDRTGQTFNVPFVEHAQIEACTLYTLWHWWQGLLVQHGNPKNISGLADLLRPEVTLINRQSSAGSRILLDSLLAEHQIDPKSIQECGNVAFSHQEVAQAISEGQADVGLAIQAVAQNGLEFIPLAQERFDLVVPEPFQKHPAMVALLQTLKTPQIRNNIRLLGGYDPEQAGEVVAVISGSRK